MYRGKERCIETEKKKTSALANTEAELTGKKLFGKVNRKRGISPLLNTAVGERAACHTPLLFSLGIHRESQTGCTVIYDL